MCSCFSRFSHPKFISLSSQKAISTFACRRDTHSSNITSLSVSQLSEFRARFISISVTHTLPVRIPRGQSVCPALPESVYNCRKIRPTLPSIFHWPFHPKKLTKKKHTLKCIFTRTFLISIGGFNVVQGGDSVSVCWFSCHSAFCQFWRLAHFTNVMATINKWRLDPNSSSSRKCYVFVFITNNISHFHSQVSLPSSDYITCSFRCKFAFFRVGGIKTSSQVLRLT